MNKILLLLLILAGCSSEPTKHEEVVDQEDSVVEDKTPTVSTPQEPVAKLFESGRLEDAKKVIFAELNKNPKNNKFWHYGGVYFILKNQYKTAKFYIDRAFELGNRTASLFSNRAYLLLMDGKTWEAVEDLHLAIEKDGNHVNANSMMAEVLIANQNFSGAAKYLQKLQDLGQENKDLIGMYAAGLIGKANYQEAASFLQDQLGRGSIGFENSYNLVLALMKLNKKQEAKTASDQILGKENLSTAQRVEITNLLQGKTS